MSKVALLQAMRLKGRLNAEAAAACLGIAIDEAHAALIGFEQAGWAQQHGAHLRLTTDGREQLDTELTAERLSLDPVTLHAHYAKFTDLNSELKSVITAWQMKDPHTPNDHSDEGYDRQVVESLVELDRRFGALLNAIVAVAPRLSPYRTRFASAVSRIRSGDHTFVARPIADSYHTVWFELHEELIGLLGLNRVDEAVAGRAL